MNQNKRVKGGMKFIGLVLMGAAAVLFFVSRTVYVHNLPVVTAVSPFNGKLTKTEKSKGTARWAENYDIYVDIGGKVEEVHVKEGQEVQKGQALFSLSFDEDQIRQDLKALKVDQDRKLTDISSLELKIETNNRYINDLRDTGYRMEAVSDFELRQLQSEIEIAEEELYKLETLYKMGAAAKSEYDAGVNALEAMKKKKTELEKIYAESVTDQNENMADKEKDRHRQIQDYTAANEMLEKEIMQARLDLERYNIQQETYENMLNKFSSNTVVYAGETGTLSQFSINKGQWITDGYYAGSIGQGNIYDIECNLSLDNNFVVVGDLYKLKNANHSFEAHVTKIKLTESAKVVTVTVQSAEISDGETFDITFEKESAQSYTLVPRVALNMDNDGYYLYQLSRRDGMLGKEYYAQKLRVYIGDYDDNYTAITKGLSFFEPVVLTSSKAFSEGQTLNLSNAGDFFEN